jgi:hypothetical protein
MSRACVLLIVDPLRVTFLVLIVATGVVVVLIAILMHGMATSRPNNPREHGNKPIREIAGALGVQIHEMITWNARCCSNVCNTHRP